MQPTSLRRILLGAVLAGLTLPSLSFAEAAGRGATGPFEMNYLKTMIDHHFGALRITELAAGTGQIRMSAISPTDRTSPTPGFDATEPHADAAEIKSMSRRDNRVQREEILMAQNLLKKWYGVTYEPKLMPDAKVTIEQLTRLHGAAFDEAFLDTFSRHHYMAAKASLDCLVARELTHVELRRYCQDIVNAQINEIDEMRHLACELHDNCDIQPQEMERPEKPGRHRH